MNLFKTVKAKQMLVFMLMISLMTLLSGMIFTMIKRFTIDMIYRQMETQAEVHITSVEAQLDDMIRQQSNLLADRELVFLIDKELLDDYERRNTLLSVQDKLFIMSSNPMIKEAVMYIPSSNYVITSESFDSVDEESGEMLADIKMQLEKMVYEDGELSYTLSESPYAEKVTPYFYLKVVFDNAELTRQLDSFVNSDGGAFWYNEENGWFLEDTLGNSKGRKIQEMSELSEGIEKIRVDGVSYLINIKKAERLGILVQYCSEKAALQELNRYTGIFYIFIIFAVGLAAVFSRYTERLVNKPLRTLYDAFQELQNGNMALRISHSAGDEFEYIYEGYNHMVEELDRTIKEVYVQKQLTAHAELKQLQAQINPHFLYNTFFLLSSRLGRENYDGAREIADYLGTYFRYITRNASDTVTLKEEMLHAEAYARIQESRFSSRIKLVWEEMPQAAENITVPRLIVQPILENAYKYGLEDKEEMGELHVYYEVGPETVLLCVENNGSVTDEKILEIRERFSDHYEGEITGMINIHRRLKNFYKQEKGLYVEKGVLGGVKITMELPLAKEEENVPAVDHR